MSDTCDAGAMSDSLSIFLMTIVCVLSIVCVALSIVVVFRGVSSVPERADEDARGGVARVHGRSDYCLVTRHVMVQTCCTYTSVRGVTHPKFEYLQKYGVEGSEWGCSEPGSVKAL